MRFASPETQFGAPRLTVNERPHPHSVQAIRAKRAGGKKVPKKYRKYHKNSKDKKTSGNIVTRAFHYVVNAVTKIMP